MNSKPTYAAKLPGILVAVILAMPPAQAADCVIFLHGLARTSGSMNKIATVFESAGYAIANTNYPSRKFPIEDLAPLAIEAGLNTCPDDSTIHFVTHSLGGILVRYYLQENEIDNLGRVVMMAPPNQGSQVVDRLRDLAAYKMMNGPAGLQLGTDEKGIPAMLGSVDYEVGIIAGTRTVNPILSQYLPNPDDGKVAVENTKVEGMSDFIVVPSSHTFIMRSTVAIDQTLRFIRTGKFSHDEQ